jgi:hypothetical protein
MPNSSDDRSSDPISAETPSVGRSEGSESEPASSTPPPPAERVSEGNDLQIRTTDSGDVPRPPRRRRRRRRPPCGADTANAAPQVPTEQPPTAADAPPSEAILAAPLPAGSEPRRRRRRRRDFQTVGGEHRRRKSGSRRCCAELMRRGRLARQIQQLRRRLPPARGGAEGRPANTAPAAEHTQRHHCGIDPAPIRCRSAPVPRQ